VYNLYPYIASLINPK